MGTTHEYKSRAAQHRLTGKIVESLGDGEFDDVKHQEKVAKKHLVTFSEVQDVCAAFAPTLLKVQALKNRTRDLGDQVAVLNREVERLSEEVERMQPPLPAAGQWQQAELREREAFSFLSDEEKIKLKIGVA